MSESGWRIGQWCYFKTSLRRGIGKVSSISPRGGGVLRIDIEGTDVFARSIEIPMSYCYAVSSKRERAIIMAELALGVDGDE